MKRRAIRKKKVNVNAAAGPIIDPFNVDTENNYIFRFLEKTKIMVCYGCGKKFRSDFTEIPEPPNDIVLAKKNLEIT